MDTVQEACCTASTSWRVDSPQNLSDVIIYRQDEIDEEESGSKAVTRGIFVTCPECDIANNDSTSEHQQCHPCKLDFEAKQTPMKVTRITALDILCDASRAEVFTQDIGYVGMEHGTRVDEALQTDDKLYLVQHSFEDPVQKCSLQLIQTPRSNKLWIHTIYITITTTSVKPSISAMLMAGSPNFPGTSSINLDKVKVMMADMGGEVSEPAKGLLRTMETFQKNKMMTGGPSLAPPGGGFGQMAAMMSMFQSLSASGKANMSDNTLKPADATNDENLHKHSEESASENGSTQQQNKDRNQRNDNDAGDHTIGISGIDKASLTMNSAIVSSIEQCFQEQISKAEERILGKVSEQLLAAEERINAKLEKILQLLSSKQCSPDSVPNNDTLEPS